jgi:hypothetical protein
MPRSTMAIASAAAWPSLQLPSTRPRTKASICAGERAAVALGADDFLRHEARYNTLVRPLLVLLTLPVTLITLGLFLFVINALMFWSASGLLGGFNVTGFGAALIGSLIYSLFGMLIDVVIERLFSRDML